MTLCSCAWLCSWRLWRKTTHTCDGRAIDSYDPCTCVLHQLPSDEMHYDQLCKDPQYILCTCIICSIIVGFRISTNPPCVVPVVLVYARSNMVVSKISNFDLKPLSMPLSHIPWNCCYMFRTVAVVSVCQQKFSQNTMAVFVFSRNFCPFGGEIISVHIPCVWHVCVCACVCVCILGRKRTWNGQCLYIHLLLHTIVKCMYCDPPHSRIWWLTILQLLPQFPPKPGLLCFMFSILCQQIPMLLWFKLRDDVLGVLQGCVHRNL